MTEFFAARWRGDVPLRRLLWRDMLLVGSAINVATTLAALSVLASNGATAAAIAVHFSSLPYNLFLFTAVWRAAADAREPRASAARTGAALWLIVTTVA